MKANTSTTGNMALESTLGKTAGNTKATGTMASSTVREFTANQMEWSAEDAGKKERESPGLMSSAPMHNNNEKVIRRQL